MGARAWRAVATFVPHACAAHPLDDARALSTTMLLFALPSGPAGHRGHPSALALAVALSAAVPGTVCRNEVSATGAGTADGINIGCKGDCGFQSPTTGANDNLVVDDTASFNDRYGIAQATGNTGNAYIRNEATGNGVANFAIDP